MLDSAARSVGKLGDKIEEWVFYNWLYQSHVSPRIKNTDAAKLQDEYAKLVAGLQDTADDAIDEDAFMTNPRKR